MKFIFWQNIISIHQSAFIKALAEKYNVTLVVEQVLDEQRKTESWNVPDMGKSKIVLSPSSEQIDEMISDMSVHHAFSGIDAYPMVYKAFKLAVNKGCKISIIAEPYDWTGIKGKLRWLKYTLLFIKYSRYIDHFFTTGSYGIKCFHQSGLPLRKLHQWGYFTESETISSSTVNQFPKVIFVGKIDTRKNILSLVDALNGLSELYELAYIIGTGPLVNELQLAIEYNSKIHYLGSLSNDKVNQLISKCDLLVLPSLFDGWGAVINEALSQGTRVLCSDMCGACILLDGNIRGGKVNLNDRSLKQELKYWLLKGSLSLDDRNQIKMWASTHISGKVAAEYLVKVINGESVEAPWLN